MDTDRSGTDILQKSYKNIRYYLSLILLLQTVSFVASKYWANTINDGFMFGFLGSNILSILFSAVALILIIILTNKQIISASSFVLITAGSISNIIDRLIYGGSVDYISILKYPTFNLADVLIVVGCCTLARDMIKSSIYKKSP